MTWAVAPPQAGRWHRPEAETWAVEPPQAGSSTAQHLLCQSARLTGGTFEKVTSPDYQNSTRLQFGWVELTVQTGSEAFDSTAARVLLLSTKRGDLEELP
ncbi:hypothetical protein MUK42_29031 [Musa troglodytarum]|uniref:Uncharacterized protein n=1 Tax=Musa troglodytarum TaxID=320322 RepID=A0A9E7JPQ6_9LILI|nr:hypothetical protein MUK42_29031 [Musa troglodytarum]